MNEKTLLKIAKRSSKKLQLPKRPAFKELRQKLDDVWWNTKMTVLWWLVKLHLFSFYKWEAMCFNRKLI